MSKLAQLDGALFKASAKEQWDAAAAGWNHHGSIIRDWLATPTRMMLEMAGVGPAMTVLDLAAGAGDQTLDLAARVGPTGRVVATDISARILGYARRNAIQAGYDNVETRVADAEQLDFQPSQFDAAICRLGLMLLPEPEKALQGVLCALKAGGSFSAVVFSGPEANPCIRILMATALRHAQMEARDPWQPGGLLSLGKPGLLDDLLRQSGFRNVITVRVQAPFRLPSAEHYLHFVRASASPIQQILAPLPEASRDAAWADMKAQLDAFHGDAEWIGPNELLLVSGCR